MNLKWKKPAHKRRNRLARQRYAAKQASKVSLPVKQYIAKAIGNNEETKFVIDAPWKATATLAAFTDFTCAITGTSEIYALIPRVTQGIDEHQRIGGEIRPTSLKATFTASLNSRMIASDYVDVDFYFLTSKQVKSQVSHASIPITKLLNAGDGNNVNYNGSLYVSHYPVNKTEFNLIKKKTVRLFKTQDCPNAQAIGSGVTSTNGSGRNNYYKTFTVKIPTPAKLTYPVAADIAPHNYFPFVVCGWHYPDDNGGTVSPNINDVRIQGQVQMYYKDS